MALHQFPDMLGININMRCIEMMKATLKALKEFKININMRCIEMLQLQEYQKAH